MLLGVLFGECKMGSYVIQPDLRARSNAVSEVANRVFANIDPDFHIWQRLPNEPEIWHQRFSAYLAMPNYERSVLVICNRERHRDLLPPLTASPPEWILISRAWRWKDRADAYDAFESRRKAREEEELKDRIRRKRLSVLASFHDKVDMAINAFNPDEDAFRLSEITGAIGTIGKEYRAEFDSEPTKRSEVVVTSIADMLKEAEKEMGYGSHHQSNIIDAEFREE